MQFYQKEFQLPAYKRGFHIITSHVLENLQEIKSIKTGMCNIFIQHTSAGLSINENADPDVRGDFERHFNKMVPENEPHYEHTMEGPDDMPAHIKSAMTGFSLTVPVTNGKLNLGTWQGIYLCEFRNGSHRRKLVATVYGE